MYILLGGTGHGSSSVAATLLEQSEQVAVMTHDDKKVSSEKNARRKLSLRMF